MVVAASFIYLKFLYLNKKIVAKLFGSLYLFFISHQVCSKSKYRESKNLFVLFNDGMTNDITT
jgi:hypothetical protein